MTDEFNLSEKEHFVYEEKLAFHGTEGYFSEDVKEFIRLLKDEIKERIEYLSYFDGLGEAMLQKGELKMMNSWIDKLAGEKLKESGK